MKNTDIKNIPDILKYFLSYLKAHNFSSGTITVYRDHVYEFLSFYKDYKDLDIELKNIGIFVVLQIETSDIRAYLVHLSYDLENNPNTRENKLNAISSFFNWVLSTNPNLKKEENPTYGINDITRTTKLPKYLSLDNAHKIQSVFDNKNCRNSIRNNMIISLFLATGIRLSELYNLNIEDIILDENCLFIKRGKGKKDRYAYYNDNCKKQLEEYLRYRNKIEVDSNALFLSERGERLAKRTIQYIIEKAYELMGLNDFDFSVHTLRHTFATLTYIYVKQDVLLLKEMLGHARITSTEIYTHVADKQIENAMNSNPLSDFNVKKIEKTA